MSAVKNFKAARNIPTPDERSSWNFRLWSYGNMRPLHCIPHSITINNTAQSILTVFIPANTWANLKRMIVWADVLVQQNAPAHPGGRQYAEGYQLQLSANTIRGAVQPVANNVNPTRYVIQRQFQFENTFNDVYEENWDIEGNVQISAATGVEHRLLVNGTVPLDNTIDANLDFLLGCGFAGSNDTCQVISAQAYIQAPLNLNRFPQ